MGDITEGKTLSEREKEVLQLVAHGLTNREIAQILTISPNTVKVHLSNIFEKSGVASRTEAALFGIEHGIVDMPRDEAQSEPSQSDTWTFISRFRWLWAGIVLLGVVAIIFVILNGVFREPEPELQLVVDATKRWQALAPLPEPRAVFAAAAYSEKIYTIGGIGQTGVSGTVFCYRFDVDAWEKLAEKPTPVANAKAVVIGERIYIPGGQLEGGAPTDHLEIYDPRRDEWLAGASLPVPLSAYALADFEGQLYVFGGWDGQRAQKSVFIYNPEADIWRQGTPMTLARKEGSAVALEDKIVLLGGRTDGVVLSDAQAYFPSRDLLGENPWSDFLAMPVARYAFGTASIHDAIFVIGGKIVEENYSLESTDWLMTGGDWIPLPMEQDFSNRTPIVLSVGSELIILDPSVDLSMTRMWAYQAFYYTIYIPFVP